MLITNNKDALNLAQMTHEFLLTLTGDMYGLQKGLTWIVVDQFLFSPSSITFFRVHQIIACFADALNVGTIQMV